MFQRAFPFFVPLKRAIPAVHLAVYRLTNGRLSATLAGQKMLLLTTTGRRTGKPRAVPLLYVDDGETVVVIGSNWGGGAHPLWVRNLLAKPEARVQIGPRKRRVTASVASGPERERLWQLVTGTYAGYKHYARRIGDAREIPLVVLTPRKAA
jgi:deazaflavin-dependent oxidoreductase (nitroreductase family)